MTKFRQRKYEQIETELSEQIQRGQLPPGSKLPTEQEIAATYDVSRLTVRQAIAGLIHSGMAYSVQGKGTFVVEKKSVAKGELRTVHFLNSSLHDSLENDYFSGQLVLNLSVEATRRGYTLAISMIPRHMTFHDFLRNNGLPPTFNGGVILANLSYSTEDLEILRDSRIPYVALRKDSMTDAIPSVGSDSSAAMELCMKTVLGYGHREIGMINCPAGYCDFTSNLDVFRSRLEQAGCVFCPGRVATAEMTSEADGARAIRKLLECNPNLTAAVIFGDRSSAGAVRELLELGYRIPEDISVVVHDRYHWLDSLFSFRLSGAQQNLPGIAAALMDILDGQRKSGIVEPRQFLVPPDWISGNSAGFPKSAYQLQQNGGR